MSAGVSSAAASAGSIVGADSGTVGIVGFTSGAATGRVRGKIPAGRLGSGPGSAKGRRTGREGVGRP